MSEQTPEEAPPPAPISSREIDLATFHQRLQVHDRLSTFGSVVGFAGSVFPALGATGFFFDLGVSDMVLAMMAGVSCIIGFCLYYTDRRFWYTGILPGAVAGPLITLITILYTQDRATIYSAEIIIPVAGGFLPALGLYYVSLRTAVLRDLRRQREEEDEELNESVRA